MLLTLPASIRIFIACEPVDFRKAHDGLLAIVRSQFAEDPFAGSVFVFLNRKRDRVKILHWDRDGFWLHYKRLEKGRYRIVLSSDAKRVELTRPELAMLLEGIDLKHGRVREPLRVPLRQRQRGRSGEQSDGSDTGGSGSSPG